jgi:hypothetical protein
MDKILDLIIKNIDEGKFPKGLFLISLGGIIFHSNRQEIDPNNIVLHTSIGLLLVSISVLLYDHFSNQYSNKQLSIQSTTNHDFEFLAEILLKSMNKKKFQYLGVYCLDNLQNINPNEIVYCDRYAKNDFSKDFLSNKINIFNTINSSSNFCNEKVKELIRSIHPQTQEVNTLRFVYDLHPGGAFIFADPNLKENSKLSKLLILGYTNKQSNVNLCTKEMGIVADRIRKQYGLKPISKVDE